MRLYSVTEVLSPYIDFSKVPEDMLSYATERGRKVHRICASIAKGLWVMDIPDECAGYVRSFQLWDDAVVEKIIAVEIEMRDEEFGIVGHPDLIIKMKKDQRYSIVDLKTPAQLRTVWAGQLSAYQYLAKKNQNMLGIDTDFRIGSLRLKSDGSTATMHWYEDSKRDFMAFLSALNAYRYFNERR